MIERWQVYEYVKRKEGNVTIRQVMREFEGLPVKEVAEGVAEYCEAYPNFRESEGA